MTPVKSFSLGTIHTLFLFFFSQPVFGHDGHDHHHWSSDVLHLLFYTAIAVAAVGIAYATFKRAAKTENPTI